MKSSVFRLSVDLERIEILTEGITSKESLTRSIIDVSTNSDGSRIIVDEVLISSKFRDIIVGVIDPNPSVMSRI